MSAQPSMHAAGSPVRCDPEGIATAALGVAQTDRRTWAIAIASGLRLACGERLPAAARIAFEDAEREALDPAHVAALPERVDLLVDLSSCDAEQRRRLADAYAQLLRDARHRVSRRIRVIEARGGVASRDDDVEVSILPASIELGGAPIPELAALEQRLRSAQQRRRLVLVIDRDEVTVGRLRELVALGKRAGFAELGVLVVDDGIYRVLPILTAGSERAGTIEVRIDSDGFSVAPPGTPPSPDGPDIPAAKPGAPLDDGDRWDFESLARRIDAASSVDARPWVRLVADDEIWVRDLVGAAERIRGTACAEDGSARCKVAGLQWVL